MGTSPSGWRRKGRKAFYESSCTDAGEAWDEYCVRYGIGEWTKKMSYIDFAEGWNEEARCLEEAYEDDQNVCPHCRRPY